MSGYVNSIPEGVVEYLTAERMVQRMVRDEVREAIRQFKEQGARASLLGSTSPLALEVTA